MEVEINVSIGRQKVYSGNPSLLGLFIRHDHNSGSVQPTDHVALLLGTLSILAAFAHRATGQGPQGNLSPSTAVDNGLESTLLQMRRTYALVGILAICALLFTDGPNTWAKQPEGFKQPSKATTS